MPAAPLVLYIELKPETKIDLRVAAKAAIAWADMVERTGSHFDPLNLTAIELEASTEGSQIIKAIISSVTEDPKTILRIAIVTSLLFIAKTTAAWTWEQTLEYIKGPDSPAAAKSLSQEDMEALAHEVANAVNQQLKEDDKNRIYQELAADENVTGAGMSSSSEQRPTTIVPRDEFPDLLFLPEVEGADKRVRMEEADLVLLKPVLTEETNKRWGFSWPYGKIGATIKHTDFLERMASGKLNVPMAQGIILKVEMEVREERHDGVWVVMEYSIVKVISVSPPERQSDFELQIPQ